MKKIEFRPAANKLEIAMQCLRLLAFPVLFTLTVFWAFGVASLVGFHLGIWGYPQWLAHITPSFPMDDPRIRLGEIGDILTGSLQPLALTWFVYAVLLQSRELQLQRHEFEKMRDEYKGNRLVIQMQADNQKVANTLANRELVRSIIQDSKLLVRRNAELSYSALARLSVHSRGPHYSNLTNKDHALSAWLGMLNGFRFPADKNSSGLDFDVVWNDQSELVIGGYRLRELIERMADQYSDLRTQAEKYEMLEYYDAFCMESIEGEITKVSYDLIKTKQSSNSQ